MIASTKSIRLWKNFAWSFNSLWLLLGGIWLGFVDLAETCLFQFFMIASLNWSTSLGMSTRARTFNSLWLLLLIAITYHTFKKWFAFNSLWLLPEGGVVSSGVPCGIVFQFFMIASTNPVGWEWNEQPTLSILYDCFHSTRQSQCRGWDVIFQFFMIASM